MLRLEVIDYHDPTGQMVVARVPEMGTAAIQLGAQLIVQQNQEAVFFRDGRAMDSFGPGRHTLSTANVPILTRLLTIPWERSPFQACVYFVGKHRFIDGRWGTRSPITMKDPDFGMVRLRGFGKYSFRVVDAPLLINEVVGTQGKVTSEQVSNYLRDVLVSGLADFVATTNIGLLQMAASFDELAAGARAKLGVQFKQLGLELTDFMINNISPPEEVQKAIDARSSMAAIGDLRSYTLYQAANGMAAAGQSQGGGSGAALGMGAGLGMMLPPLLQQAWQGAAAGGATTPMAAGAGVVPNPATTPPASAGIGTPAATPARGAAPAHGASQAASATTAQGATPQPQRSQAPANSGGTTLDFSQLAATRDTTADAQQLLRDLAQQSQWSVQTDGTQWRLTIPIGSLRKQVVHVDFAGQDDAGNKMISIWSSCGAMQVGTALTLLRYNAQLVHGAFAVQQIDGGDVIVLRANLLTDTVDGLELTRTITAIAWQADQVEQQMLGSDQR